MNIQFTNSGGTAPIKACMSNTNRKSATGIMAGKYFQVDCHGPTGCTAPATMTVTQPTKLVIA